MFLTSTALFCLGRISYVRSFYGCH